MRSSRSRRVLPACLLLLLSGAFVAGCTPGANLPPLENAADSTTYRLGAGDQVRVITYDEPQLTNTFTVGAKGTIDFPLLGTIAAADRSPAELASMISDELRARKLIVHPSISVEVMLYRPIFVLGEVAHPGQYAYQPGMTMLSAVALAGGFTYRAVTAYASDVRSEGSVRGQAIEGKIGRAGTLRPGDVVTVFERYF